uniref:hypothetical protein n=1 Tax=Ningiella ruwaisensis TaxID=2364274 RepID=UPI00109FFD31|nr:hypothetical protein [Ningiella ruwaisensis]
MKSMHFSIYLGLLASLIGLVTFVLNWNFFDVIGGPLPGYQIFLFPGNQSLVYIWHPLFTEEMGMYQKLGLMLFSQFMIVAIVAEIIQRLVKRMYYDAV